MILEGDSESINKVPKKFKLIKRSRHSRSVLSFPVMLNLPPVIARKPPVPRFPHPSLS